MFFSQNASEIRQFYISSWKKYQQKEELSALEQQICHVIEMHPQYQSWLKQEHLDTQFHPEEYAENPFLHMGLHLALQEQIQTNRPMGIKDIYFSLIKKNMSLSVHEKEHQLMEILAHTLWQAQKNQMSPDEMAYLSACRKLLEN